MLNTSLVIAVGGAVGSLARYWLTVLLEPLSRTMPWSTVAINVVGSFAISFVGGMTAAGGRFPASELVRVAFIVGVCGGFTTFSSFSLQTVELIKAGSAANAALNVIVSVVLCLVATATGLCLAEHLNADPRTR